MLSIGVCTFFVDKTDMENVLEFLLAAEFLFQHVYILCYYIVKNIYTYLYTCAIQNVGTSYYYNIIVIPTI